MAFAAAAVALALACADTPRARSDSLDSARAADSANRPPAAPPPIPQPPLAEPHPPLDTRMRPATNWDSASVEKRLESAGLAPVRVAGPVRHPFMSVTGRAYHLGEAELQVFVYADSAAVARDVQRLDTATVAPPGQRTEWRTKPTLIISNNLAAILLSRNERQIERVQLALTAGRLPPE